MWCSHAHLNTCNKPEWAQINPPCQVNQVHWSCLVEKQPKDCTSRLTALVDNRWIHVHVHPTTSKSYSTCMTIDWWHLKPFFSRMDFSTPWSFHRNMDSDTFDYCTSRYTLTAINLKLCMQVLDNYSCLVEPFSK